jgi:hypothetical protein
MKRFAFISASVAALAMSFATSATAQTFKEQATCKLTNTAANKAVYEGPCKVKQSASGNQTIFSVKMGDTEPFLFAGVRGQSNWMHGADKVQFTDAPGGGIFRWSTFALVVAEGNEASSSSSGGGGIAVDNMGRYCAGEASAKFHVSPRDIATQSATQTQGMWEVWGQYAAQPSPQVFVCSFNAEKQFLSVDKNP